jgi:hypothetical protein
LIMNRLATSALLLTIPLSLSARAVAQSGLAPQELWWPNADRKSGTPKGLLYTPEVISALVAGKPPEGIPAHIARAIREQTPIVVMWTFQNESSVRELSRPFHLSISEPRAVNAVAPVWEKQDAADLRTIDPYTQFGDVGVMGAFPRNALQPGQLIFMYVELPDDGTGRIRVVQVLAEVPRSGGGSAK